MRLPGDWNIRSGGMPKMANFAWPRSPKIASPTKTSQTPLNLVFSDQ
jgi:hypothetical protein